MENMLSIRKVRRHGISTSHWTTRDKITQYKGLINLYKRDQAIAQSDLKSASKNQENNLAKVQKKICEQRAALDNSIRGDKQKLRNTLQAHKELQLAYQNLPPKRVIEQIAHVNFRKRKELDRLMDLLGRKKNELIELKLELSVLEDRHKDEQDPLKSRLPIQQATQKVAGLIQNAVLKQEVASKILEAYVKINEIMKKDSIFFNGILETLKNDGLFQSKCMINATTVGQLATEHLDDRKFEFEKLQKTVIRAMEGRKRHLELASTMCSNTSRLVRHLIRTESDGDVCANAHKGEDLSGLIRELGRMESTMDYLRDKTYAPNPYMIYDNLQVQRQQYQRLRTFVNKLMEHRDRLQNKHNHAEVMRDLLRNSMLDSTLGYGEKKKELLQKIEEQKERKRNYEKEAVSKRTVLAKVRISFNDILEYVKPIRVPTPSETRIEVEGSVLEESRRISLAEGDFATVMPVLKSKLNHLYGRVQNTIDPEFKNAAYKMFESNVRQHINLEETKTDTIGKDLLEDAEFSVCRLMSRHEMKKEAEGLARTKKLEAELK